MGAPKNPRARRGFTLVEILVVIVILGLVMAMAAVLLRSVSAAQKRSITATRMANVEAAIVQFVMQQKRLPCPADGTQTASTGGLEMLVGATCPSQQHGVVPWRSIGLSAADIMDGWDRRLTYRIASGMADANAIDMSLCDPAGGGGVAGTACNSCSSATLSTCTTPANFLAAKGLTVKNLSGITVMGPPTTGAAYVLISHGESGGGAYLDTGVLSTSASTDGTEEQKNYANLALGAYYVDDQTSDVAGATHFDDIVLRPSILNVASKAGLGPRSH